MNLTACAHQSCHRSDLDQRAVGARPDHFGQLSPAEVPLPMPLRCALSPHLILGYRPSLSRVHAGLIRQNELVVLHDLAVLELLADESHLDFG